MCSKAGIPLNSEDNVFQMEANGSKWTWGPKWKQMDLGSEYWGRPSSVGIAFRIDAPWQFMWGWMFLM